MRKYLIFSIFVMVASLLVVEGAFAARGGGANARRSKGAIKTSRTRINVNKRTAGVVSVNGDKDALTGTQNTSTLTTNTSTGTLDNQQCVDSITQCLSSDSLCGSGLFKCRDVFTNGTELQTDSRGQSCADKLTSCQCYYNNEPPTPDSDCSFVWDQAYLQIQGSGYDMGQCQSKFMACAKKECSGANYQNCVDLIDTVVRPDGNDDTIDTQDFLRDWLSPTADATTAALSTSLRSLLIQRLSQCEADVLTRCEGYVAGTDALSMDTDTTVGRTINYFFQDFARKASEGLIDYQETHAKQKWLKAEACVDTVDQCMAKHCGTDYKKCLHEDATVDFTAANNFRTLCQKEMIGCSEIRVEVGLPGYQFLQNPAVDGVEAVWNEFISKKLLAHGNKVATDRRELERELDKLLAAAQRECDLSGGRFGYTQTPLLNYQVKFGSNTDDYKGDRGPLHNIIADHDGDGVPDKYRTDVDGTTDDTVYGEAEITGSGQKMDRFYDRPDCYYNVTLQRAKSLLARSDKNKGTVELSMRQSGVACDEKLFPDAFKSSEPIAWGAVIGGVLGGTAGVVGTQAMTEEGSKNRGAKTAGIGLAGAGGGALAGAAIQKETMKKKLTCVIRGQGSDASGHPTVIPVANFGQGIILPPIKSNGTGGSRKAGTGGGRGSQSILSAFDAVDEFYRAHPDLIVQRGEYRNANATTTQTAP